MESHIPGYDAVNAMLLNEFLKEHRKVEELEKQIEKLAAGLQNVSALVEIHQVAPQKVADSQQRSDVVAVLAAGNLSTDSICKPPLCERRECFAQQSSVAPPLPT